jgi:threonine dehydratase
VLANIPSKQDIIESAKRIEPYVHRTAVMTSSTLDTLFHSTLFFKCENFQKVGAFKSRGAVNAVFSLEPAEAERGVATHSSGNHAQALARAALLRKVPAYIVMPENAPEVKVEAVKGYGGKITYCKPTLQSREETIKVVMANTGAVEIHPYDNYTIIAGQATAARELMEDAGVLDLILCPVGGGGLLAGTALSAHYFGENTKVIACEPKGADDAFRSFQAGKIIPSVEPRTIADGLLTSLGKRNFPIIQKYVTDIVTVSEEAIIEAMKLVFERMKLVIEPSAAVVLAALLEKKAEVEGKRVGLIFSGGNIDLKKLPFQS